MEGYIAGEDKDVKKVERMTSRERIGGDRCKENIIGGAKKEWLIKRM